MNSENLISPSWSNQITVHSYFTYIYIDYIHFKKYKKKLWVQGASSLSLLSVNIFSYNYPTRTKSFADRYRLFSWILKTVFRQFFLFWSSTNLPWGQKRFKSNTKFGPDLFSRFDVYWTQTDRQTDQQTIICKRYTRLSGYFVPIFYFNFEF